MGQWTTRILAAVLAGAAAASPLAARDAKVLIFSHSTGFRHASIEPAVAALKQMGARMKLAVVATEDPNVFTADGLKDVDAIILVSNSTKKDAASEWWVGPRREAFQAFVRRGGGVLGIHAASDSHYNWPWYGRMIGGYFARHPEGTPTGKVTIVDRKHRSAKGVSTPATRTDEWYYFDDYNPETNLIATLDPQSIRQKEVNPKPMSWSHTFEGGRVFYTAMGHTTESYSEPWFLRHLEGGLSWVLRR